jgi:hypothetical protein
MERLDEGLKDKMKRLDEGLKDKIRETSQLG